MTDLYEIQRQIVARIGERPVGSASRFALMDAADAVSRAITAEAREAPVWDEIQAGGCAPAVYAAPAQPKETAA